MRPADIFSQRLLAYANWLNDRRKRNVYTRLMKVSADSLYYENRFWRDYLLQIRLDFQYEIYEKRKEEPDIWDLSGKIADD